MNSRICRLGDNKNLKGMCAPELHSNKKKEIQNNTRESNGRVSTHVSDFQFLRSPRLCNYKGQKILCITNLQEGTLGLNYKRTKRRISSLSNTRTSHELGKE